MIVLWNLVKSRWFWMAITAVLACIITFQKPKVVIQDKIVVKEVIKWKMKATVTGGTSTIDSQGNVTNIGGTIHTEGSGESNTNTNISHTEKPKDKWKLMAGLGVMFPKPNLQIQVGYNIGHILFLDIGATGMIQTTSLTDFAPERYGAGVIVSF